MRIFLHHNVGQDDGEAGTGDIQRQGCVEEAVPFG